MIYNYGMSDPEKNFKKNYEEYQANQMKIVQAAFKNLQYAFQKAGIDLPDCLLVTTNNGIKEQDTTGLHADDLELLQAYVVAGLQPGVQAFDRWLVLSAQLRSIFKHFGKPVIPVPTTDDDFLSVLADRVLRAHLIQNPTDQDTIIEKCRKTLDSQRNTEIYEGLKIIIILLLAFVLLGGEEPAVKAFVAIATAALAFLHFRTSKERDAQTKALRTIGQTSYNRILQQIVSAANEAG